MEMILAWIGVVLSFVGATISIFQSISAARSRSEAERIRAYLTEKFENYPTSVLRGEILSANQSVTEMRSRATLVKDQFFHEGLRKISDLLLKIMSDKLYRNEAIKSNVDKSRRILDSLDNDNFKVLLSQLNSNLASIARELDQHVRQEHGQ